MLVPSGFADERSSLGERGKRARWALFPKRSPRRKEMKERAMPRRALTMRQDRRVAITRRSWKHRSLFSQGISEPTCRGASTRHGAKGGKMLRH